MHSRASARSLADEFDALARERSGRAAAGARRRASELRLEALLLRGPARARRPDRSDPDPDGDHDRR